MANFTCAWVLIAVLAAGCSQIVNPDAGSADAAPDTVAAIDAPMDVPASRADAMACGDAAACGPAQVCVHFDGSRLGPQSVCMDLPASCGGVPSCSCPDLPGCHGPDTTCMTCSVTGRDVSCGCPCC